MAVLQGREGPLNSGDTAYDIVAIASSAGGLQALQRVFSALPAGFPAAIVVVQHLEPSHPSQMAAILGRHARLRIKEAQDGEALRRGVAYVAPPDRHLLVAPGGTLSVTQSDLVRFLRPSADLLFESVAAASGSRAIGVVLTGTGNDGAVGVKAIKTAGGKVLAQDQETSAFLGMPQAAMGTGCVDRVLPLDEIAPVLVALVMGSEPA